MSSVLKLKQAINYEGLEYSSASGDEEKRAMERLKIASVAIGCGSKKEESLEVLSGLVCWRWLTSGLGQQGIGYSCRDQWWEILYFVFHSVNHAIRDVQERDKGMKIGIVLLLNQPYYRQMQIHLRQKYLYTYIYLDTKTEPHITLI